MVQQPSSQPAYDPAKAQEMARIAQQMTWERRIKSGASNFYWVAALSVVNSLASIFQGGLFFVVGLATTLFVDAVASNVAERFNRSPIVLVIGFLVSFFLAGIFVFFGFFASKQHSWAFLVGMALYALDAILMLAFKEWLGFAFHLLFLYGMWNGFQALRKYKSLQPGAITYAIPPAETMR